MMQNSALETSLDGLLEFLKQYHNTIQWKMTYNKWRRVLLAFIVVPISNCEKAVIPLTRFKNAF